MAGRLELDAGSEAVLARYLAALAARGRTAGSGWDYGGYIRRFGRFIAPRPLLDATRADLDAWSVVLAAGGVSASSRDTYRKRVRGLLRWAHAEGLVDEDRTARPATPTPPRDAVRVSPPAENRVPVLDADTAALLVRYAAALGGTDTTAGRQRQLCSAARRFAVHLAPTPLRAATPSDVEAWRQNLLARCTANGTGATLGLLGVFWRWALAAGIAPVDPHYAAWRARLDAPPRPPLSAIDEAAIADSMRAGRRRNLRPATLRHRDKIVRMFGEWLAPRSLLDATEADVEAWVDDQIARGLKVESRRTYLAHLRTFYGWAARRGLITADPTLELQLPKVPQPLPRPIGEHDLQLALRAAGPLMRAWLVLGGYCGLRAGEIGRLRREHVLDAESPPMVAVVNGKGGRNRTVPLPVEALAELGPFLTGRRGPLWLGERKHPEKAVTEGVAEHLHNLGLPYTCHSLRHRYATRVYQLSRDLRMTQEWLGHASPATTQIYTAYDRERGADVIAELGAALRRRRRQGDVP